MKSVMQRALTLVLLSALGIGFRSQAASVGGWGYGFSTNYPPSLTNAAAIAAGSGHGLALLTNGTVVGWGDNSYGQANVPPDLSNVVAIAATFYHNLALKAV